MVIRDFQNGNKADLTTLPLFGWRAMLRRESRSHFIGEKPGRSSATSFRQNLSLFRATRNVRQTTVKKPLKNAGKMMFCQIKWLKNCSRIFDLVRRAKALETVKSSDKAGEKSESFFKMGHFTSQNGPFCSAK